MQLAFVFINVELGAEDDVLKTLKKISNVKEAYAVYGVYDIVAKVEAESMKMLKNITWKIRKIDKIRSSMTMLVEKTE
ncbi:MAG: Lrp/AsnC ligand binding domain-containing protein [Candidatus Bathyarchaeota archaeon]|nr:MAG: Lrp/AsnC ligand binding domain-containing protein [Candidatus Bathyarchaeota archaeon]